MQAEIDDKVARSILDRAHKVSGRRIKRIDVAHAKVSNQNVIAERPEVLARFGDAPRRIQRSVRNEPLHEVAFEIEDVNDALSRSGDRRMFRGILHRIGHEDLVPDNLQIVGSVSRREDSDR